MDIALIIAAVFAQLTAASAGIAFGKGDKSDFIMIVLLVCAIAAPTLAYIAGAQL